MSLNQSLVNLVESNVKGFVFQMPQLASSLQINTLGDRLDNDSHQTQTEKEFPKVHSPRHRQPLTEDLLNSTLNKLWERSYKARRHPPPPTHKKKKSYKGKHPPPRKNQNKTTTTQKKRKIIKSKYEK